MEKMAEALLSHLSHSYENVIGDVQLDKTNARATECTVCT